MEASGAPGGESIEDASDPTLDAPTQKPAPTAFQTVDMAAMMAETKKELAETEVGNHPEMTPAAFEEAWGEFMAENAGSTLVLMMGQTKPGLEGDEIVVSAGSQRVMASLRENSSLINYMRDRFGKPQLAMRLVVDKTMAPKTVEVKRRLSARDKFLAMRQKNPEIDDLRKLFDLRPEE